MNRKKLQCEGAASRGPQGLGGTGRQASAICAGRGQSLRPFRTPQAATRQYYASSIDDGVPEEDRLRSFEGN